MQKILILTYYWPPSGGAGVQRWLKFVKYLSEMDYEIHIYTPENPEAPAIDNSLIADVPQNVIVIKKPIFEPFGFYKKFTGKKGALNAGFLTETETKKNSLPEKISLFIRANFFIPDAKMFWIKPSYNFLRKYIKENNIPIVISSGPPHSLHLIAEKLKRKNKIKWIADFRDPWTNIDFYNELPMLKMADARHKKLEKTVLKNADKIITVGKTLTEELQVICPSASITVITNGFDTKVAATDTILDSEFTILHVGSINAARSHESFYKSIAELIEENEKFKANIKLIFIGKIDIKTRNYIKTYKLDSYTEFISYLPHNEIYSFQIKAQLLYLPLNNSLNVKGILTGKFFEYLAAKRPILAQGPTDGDLSLILKETDAGEIFDFEDEYNLKKYLEARFEKYLSAKNTCDSYNIEKYSRKNLTLELDKIISKL